MKAVVYREYAPDDDYAKILKVEDIDSPKPKPDEVVFTNKASALNYNDIWGMRGVPIAIPLPHVSGSCLLYTSPSPRDLSTSRMPSSA